MLVTSNTQVFYILYITNWKISNILIFSQCHSVDQNGVFLLCYAGLSTMCFSHFLQVFIYFKCCSSLNNAASRRVFLPPPVTLMPETDMQSTGKRGWTFPASLIDNLNEGSSSESRVWQQSRHRRRRQVREQSRLDSEVDSTTDLSVSCAESAMRSWFMNAKMTPAR